METTGDGTGPQAFFAARAGDMKISGLLLGGDGKRLQLAETLPGLGVLSPHDGLGNVDGPAQKSE